tara:strand:+ start:770 stop:1216 length:447 start_codon:yes stop_codon:yes gene_type:complete
MTIINEKEFRARMKKRLTVDAPKKLSRALARSVMVVRGEAIDSIASGSKSGATYKRGGTEHKASAAGEAPATDTGTLISGITTEVKIMDKVLVGMIKAFASDGGGGNYATHLEFGTRNMSARPFMQPALQKSEAKINKIFKQEGVFDK